MSRLKLELSELSFLAGLMLYASGQYLIFVYYIETELLHAQKPIDFAHWFMLIGVLMLVPQIGSFPKNAMRIAASPTLTLGIGLTVGMCVIDFVFWGIDSKPLKQEVVTVLREIPAIWQPFMNYSGILLLIGLVLSSATYWRSSRAGFVAVVGGVSTVYFGGGWLNAAGYLVVALGFYLAFAQSK